MKKKNKILSLVLAFVLLFANVQPIPVVHADEQNAKSGSGMTITLRVEGVDKIAVSKRKITLPDTYKSLSEYGLEEVTDNGIYTPMHVLAQYCENEGISTDVIKAEENGNINSFQGMGGNGESFLMFVINNQYQADENGIGYLFGNYPLKDGDSVVLYDYIWSNTSAYAYFDNESISATAEEPFPVKVNTHDGMGGWNPDVNAAGAKIVLEDMSGNPVDDSLYTSTAVTEDGSAVVSVNQAGDYRLTVARNGADGKPDLSRAYASLHVKKAEAISDEEAVEQAALALMANAGQFEKIESDVVLPNVGVKETSITWKSMDEEFLGNDGTLKKRLVGEDKKITLKATVSKGTVSKEVELTGTIKGYYLSSLSVTPGTLGFNPNIKDYTVCVPQDTEKVMVSLNAGKEASFAKIEDSFIFGEDEVKGEKEVVLGEEETVIEIEAFFPKAGGMQTAATITVKKSAPGKPLPELPASWPQHYGKADNNAVTDKKSAINNAELVWKTPGEAVNEWVNYAGHPIIVNGDLYTARGNKLQIIDGKTGVIKKSAELVQKTGYYSYITYGDGKIFVPLENGQVQCFNASTLESLFITEVPGNGWQALSSVYYQNGMIYTGFATSSGNEGAFSAYRTLDTNVEETLEEIKPEWSVDTGKGYYGSGAVAVNGGKYLVFAGDAGIVTVVDAITGKEISRVTLAGAARTAIVSADGYLWLATKSTNWEDTSGNKIYKLAVDGQGQISKKKEAVIPDITASTPVVADGKVIVTGGAWGKGFIQVYDLDLNLLAETQTESEVKSPTATTAYDDLYVYFAQNVTPGGIYVAKISKDNKMTISMLHAPEAEYQNYSMSNIIVGEDGMIYYANDSGYLFALKEGKGSVKPEPNPEPTPAPDRKPGQKPAAKQEVSSDANETDGQETENSIVKAIKESADSGKESVIISDVPEVIEAEVFAELVKHPEMKLILDCRTYTISIQGSNIVNTEIALATGIEKVESTISKEQEEKLGVFEQYHLLHEGELPGKLTVVLKLSEILKNMKELYLYDVEQMESSEKAVVNAEYVMFTLENSNDFILAEEKVSESKEVEVTDVKVELTADKNDTGNSSIVVFIVSGCVIVLVVVVRIMLKRARRKGKNEEK